MNQQEVTAQPNNYTVYKHTSPSGKVYIGITGKTVKERWHGGNGYYRNAYFYKAIKKYGWQNIKHEVLFEGLTLAEAEAKERELIKLYKADDPRYGYNGTSGGESGWMPNEEARRKISEAHKGLRYNIGVKFTEERKRHLRENHADCKGEKNSQFGRRWTPEEIAIRQAHRTYAVGGNHPTARPILQKDMNGNIVKRWGSISEASKVFCRTSIKDVLKGKYKQHKGFLWEYEVQT